MQIMFRLPENLRDFCYPITFFGAFKKHFFGHFVHNPYQPDTLIYFVTESHGLRPGPRVADLTLQVARMIHPDADLPTP